MKLYKRVAGLMSVIMLMMNVTPIMGQSAVEKNEVQDELIFNIGEESRRTITTEGSLGVFEPNEIRRSDWTIFNETDTEIILGEYTGTTKDVIIAPELDGKQVLVRSYATRFPSDMKSLTIREDNGKKVKVSGESLTYFLGNQRNLQAVDLSGLDTSNVTDMKTIFYNCSALTDLTGLENWDVSNVTSMDLTFAGCSGLTNLTELANWDVSSVVNLQSTFEDCSGLTDLTGLANWDVSSVINLQSTFKNCSGLTDLTGLANWDVSSVINMESTFTACSKLTDLTGLTNWDVSNVTSLIFTFDRCVKLKDLAGLENWNVSSVTDMRATFRWCDELEIADLSKWNTSNLEKMSSMFKESLDLKVIDLSGFSLDNCDEYSTVFTAYTIYPLLVIAKDEKLKNYNYIKDHRIPSGPIFNANGGEFSDSTIKNQSKKVFVLEDITENTINSIIDKAKDSIETPIKMGYTFDIWSLNKAGIAGTNLKLDLYNKLNQSYYALWKSDRDPVNTPPTIIATDKEMLVGDRFNPLQGVKAYDKEDGYITLSYANIIRNEVNVNIPGIYEVEYQVTDSQGVQVTKIIKVIVKQRLVDINQAPIIEIHRTEFNVGEEIRPLEYITIKDDEDVVKVKTIKIGSTMPFEVKDGKEYFKEEGKFTITYYAVDEQGASTTKTFDITVKRSANNNPSEPNRPNESSKPNKPSKNHYGIGSIVHNQYMNGYEDGTFKADNSITRGEFAAVLTRILLEGKEVPKKENVFSDVGSTYFAKNEINYLASMGVLEGYEDGTYRPLESITRAEFAVMLARIESLDKVEGTFKEYRDVKASHWAYDSIQEVTKAGYMVGYEEERFECKKGITRAESAATLNRIYRIPCNVDEVKIYKMPYSDVSEQHWAYTDIVKASIKHEHAIEEKK